MRDRISDANAIQNCFRDRYWTGTGRWYALRAHCERPIDIGLIFSAPRDGTKPIGAIKLPAQTEVVATS